MNYIDIALLIILILFTVRGFIRGAVSELSGFFSLVLGLFIARSYSASLRPFLSAYVPIDFVAIASFLLMLIGTYILVIIVMHLLTPLFSHPILGKINGILGTFVGAFKGVFLCMILVYLASFIFIASPNFNASLLVPAFQDIMLWFLNESGLKIPV